MPVAIGGFSLDQYRTYLAPDQPKMSTRVHWVARFNLSRVSYLVLIVNRLTYFLLSGCAFYPSNSLLFEKFKTCDANLISTAEELEEITQIFNRFQKCADLAENVFYKLTFEKIEKDLKTVKTRLNPTSFRSASSSSTPVKILPQNKEQATPNHSSKGRTPLTKGSIPEPPKPPPIPTLSLKKEQVSYTPSPKTLNVPHSPGPLSFENEPKEPDLKITDIKKMDIKQLNKQILETENYLKILRAILEPIQTLVDQNEKLEESLDMLLRDAKSYQARLVNEESKLAVLNQADSCSFLKLKIKEGAEIEMPFLSDSRFEELNQELIKRGFNLSTKFSKTGEIETIQKSIKDLKKKAERYKKEIDQVKDKIQQNKAKKNNEIPFDNFKKLLDNKNVVKEKWERVLLTCRRQIKYLLDPKPNKQIAAFNPFVKSGIETLMDDPKFLKRFPELAKIDAFNKHHQAQILLRGNDYHLHLIS